MNKVKIYKEVLFCLLRDRFSKETERLNEEYLENQKEGNDIIPTIIASINHQVPNMKISINIYLISGIRML